MVNVPYVTYKAEIDSAEASRVAICQLVWEMHEAIGLRLLPVLKVFRLVKF